jgi:E3 ubiquitin-protein ligase RHF
MASGTDDKAKMESLTSAAAFVEGGIQDACDDACSICLEAFCESDPSALTSCKHEFHLQCILEWCQRSSQCPMCWQAISMKDPTRQVNSWLCKYDVCHFDPLRLVSYWLILT